MEAVVCHSVSPSACCCPNSFICKRSLQWVRSGSGLWRLLHHQSWTLTKTPLGSPAVALSHGDPAAMVLQDQSFYVLYQVIDGVDTGSANSKPWFWARVVAELVSPPARLCYAHITGASSSAPIGTMVR